MSGHQRSRESSGGERCLSLCPLEVLTHTVSKCYGGRCCLFDGEAREAGYVGMGISLSLHGLPESCPEMRELQLLGQLSC